MERAVQEGYTINARQRPMLQEEFRDGRARRQLVNSAVGGVGYTSPVRVRRR
jgi:hypothetical protein